MCDNNAHGWLWFMQPSVAVPSSAIVGGNGCSAPSTLPSAIRVDDGLTLKAHRGTESAGYSWTDSVSCSGTSRTKLRGKTVPTAGVTLRGAGPSTVTSSDHAGTCGQRVPRPCRCFPGYDQGVPQATARAAVALWQQQPRDERF